MNPPAPVTRQRLLIPDQCAAIDDDGLAGHKGPGGRGQPDGGACNRFRPAHPAQWRAGQATGQSDGPKRRAKATGQSDGIGFQRRGKVGVDQPRCDGIGPHPRRPPFHRKIARQLGNRRLGQRIGAQHPVAAQTRDRGHQDHRAPPRHRRSGGRPDRPAARWPAG